MSKLYNKYLELRASSSNQENTLYLFKSGLFFIFIDRDAQIMSNILNLKLSHLNENILKCGFPAQALPKYLNMIKNTIYNVEIVSLDLNKVQPCSNYIYQENLKVIIDEILKINIDSLSISQTYDFLYNIQNKLKKIKSGLE